MNVRKPVDYSAMFEALDTLMAADLPQMELYCEIGWLVSSRRSKGAAGAHREIVLDFTGGMCYTEEKNSVMERTTNDERRTMAKSKTTKSVYTFGGWYKESGCTTAWDFDTDTVTGDITLYAKWTENAPVHTHSYSSTWSSDASHHWYECSCGEKSAIAAHMSGEWIIDREATSTLAGAKHKECTVCGYVMETEDIPQLPPEHTHSYAPEWKSDTAGHWHECSCGDKSGYAAHTPGEWIVDTQPTSSTPGQRHKECTICGYTMQTGTIPATGGGSSGGGGGGSYTPPTYPPTVERPGEGGGAATVTPSNPKQGDTVTVTPKPDSGYEVDKITVTDRNGKPVEVTKKPDGTYTFKQPSGRVKVDVTYRPIDRPWNNPFTDVSEGDWYYEAVRFVRENGLMNGYSDGRFGANDTLSRAQLAQILFNKEGRPAVNGGGFNDVDSSAWYADAVTWAAENGIVGGYGNGIFGPNDPITREQLAVMLWRYSGSPAATNKELHFNDTDEISGFALVLCVALAGCNQPAQPQGSKPTQAPSDTVSTPPVEEPTQPASPTDEPATPTPAEGEQTATLYIGTKAGGFTEYSMAYEGKLTPELLIQGITDLTGWNLTLADDVISGKGGMSVCLSSESSLFTGPPDPQKEEFHMYDVGRLTETILDSIQKTLQEGFTLEGGDLDALDIWYFMEGEQPLELPGLGLSWPIDQPYQWEGAESK